MNEGRRDPVSHWKVNLLSRMFFISNVSLIRKIWKNNQFSSLRIFMYISNELTLNDWLYSGKKKQGPIDARIR